MKKTLLISLLALLLVGCWQSNSKEEPKESVAKESTWDLFLIGSWRYNEVSDKKSDYPQGIENFYANGDYTCYTENKKGEKVVINGTWKLDDKEDFVILVTRQKVESAEETISSSEEEIKYVVNSLAPKDALNYQIDGVYRSAEWVE
jgi:hypothetical protein